MLAVVDSGAAEVETITIEAVATTADLAIAADQAGVGVEVGGVAGVVAEVDDLVAAAAKENDASRCYLLNY